MDVLERVKELVVEQLGVDAEEVTEDASFVDDLGADSLDIVELVMAFEEEFDLEIADEDAEKIQSVGNAVEYIKQRLGSGSRAGPFAREGPARPPRQHNRRARCEEVETMKRRVVVTGMGALTPLGVGRRRLVGGVARREERGRHHPLRPHTVYHANCSRR